MSSNVPGVYGNIIYNRQNLKIIQMFVNIIDTNVAMSCSGILHSDEKVTYCYRQKVSTTET